MKTRIIYTNKDIHRLDPAWICISPGPKDPAHAGISKAVIEHFGPRIPVLGYVWGCRLYNEIFGSQTRKALSRCMGKPHWPTERNVRNVSSAHLGIEPRSGEGAWGRKSPHFSKAYLFSGDGAPTVFVCSVPHAPRPLHLLCSSFDKQFFQCGLIMLGDKRQRSRPVVSLDIDVGPLSEQTLDDLLAAFFGGGYQRG